MKKEKEVWKSTNANKVRGLFGDLGSDIFWPEKQGPLDGILRWKSGKYEKIMYFQMQLRSLIWNSFLITRSSSNISSKSKLETNNRGVHGYEGVDRGEPQLIKKIFCTQ